MNDEHDKIIIIIIIIIIKQLLNISVNNLSSISNNNAQPKKGAELSKRNKELEESIYMKSNYLYKYLLFKKR